MDGHSPLRPQPGSAVAIRRGTYEHYVLYAGAVRLTSPAGRVVDETDAVVHIDAKSQDPRISVGPWQRVLAGHSWRIVDMPPAFERDEIVRRALSRLDQGGYDLVRGNCEHFVRWCITGSPKSEQVERAARLARTAAGVAAAAAGTVLAAGLAAREIAKRSPRG